MTVTEVPPDVHTAEAVTPEPAQPSGLAALIGSGDPRTVGKLFIGTSLLFFLLTSVSGLLVGLEQIDRDNPDDIISAEWFHQVVTLHELSGVFLFLLPLILGLALVVVPLQVGASTVAFPRASAAGYWAWLVGSGLWLAGYANNGGPFGGDADGVELFVLAFVALIVALCTVAVSVVTTVLTMRAPGMSLRRTPLFAWSMVVAGTVWLLTLPVVAGLLALYYFDFKYGFDEASGTRGIVFNNTTQLYDLVRWVSWQPALYALAIPALGIISDIVPVFARRRLFQHRAAMTLIGLFGAMSFGAWAQLWAVDVTEQTVAAGQVPWLEEAPWGAASVLAVVALLGLMGLWTLTVFLGRLRLGGPMMLAIAAGGLLVAGVGAGVATTIPALDLFGTTWTTAQGYAVLVGGLVAAVAGLVFWAPKIYGHSIAAGVARLVAPLLLIGGLVLAVPYALAGLMHQSWWAPTFVDQGNEVDELGAIETMNVVAVIGMAVVLAATVLVGLGLIGAALSKRQAADDPWDGHTLEWATASPPPVGNFAEIPEISSEAPVYDKRHADAATTKEVAA